MSEAASPPAASSWMSRLATATRGLAALGLIAAWLVLMRKNGWTTLDGGGLFSLGFLLVAGTVGGKVAAFFGLPQLTGFLAVGVLSGPYGLGLFTVDDVKSLTLINHLALALIALQAGAELTIPMLRRSLRSLAWASTSQTIIIVTGMTFAFALAARWMPFTGDLSFGALLAVGTVWGAMAASKAPADTLAILSETGAKGPLAEHSLGVVVVLDVLVLVVFTVALMLAKSAVVPGAELSVHAIEELGVELVASVAAGTTFGLVIALYFWAVNQERLLFTIAVAYGITAFCAYFHYDTLLVFVVAGFVVMNLTREGHALVETTESAGAAVMVVFFATAGAQLDVSTLKEYGGVALLLVFARIFFTYVSCQIGHRLADDPPSVRRYAFTGFISQAGVTIGLGIIAAETLGEVGRGINSLIIAVIGINELIGPVAFKLGLAQARKLEDQANDDDSDKPVAAPAGPASTISLGAREALVGRALGGQAAALRRDDDAVVATLSFGEGESCTSGQLVCRPGEPGTLIELDAQLCGPLGVSMSLTPYTGRMDVARTMRELHLGDAPLDGTFFIDAPESARAILMSARAPLLKLGQLGGTLKVVGRRVRVRAPVRSDEHAMVEDAVRTVAWLLRRLSAEAVDLRSDDGNPWLTAAPPS